ncbi:MAG: hypothetical protein ACXWJX_02350 [Limisphaerales bacterium]
MWHQVMSFFRWTFKEMQSESQVRLYVNPKLGRWGAWAFPQEARTGMSARELTIPEKSENAMERFEFWNSTPSDDWLYFCTAHHHCSASAFQSHTDEENERNQDGLHITIGKLDADRHDLHARLYIDGNCFDPDMSLFWHVDAGLTEQIPRELFDSVARFQMCERVTVDFPDEWRKNIVEVKSDRQSAPMIPYREWDYGPGEMRVPLCVRIEEALEEITRHCSILSTDEEVWLAALQRCSGDEITQIIIEACIAHEVTPGDLQRAMFQEELHF